jgi:PAS domain S-box-containing protein
VTQDRNFSRAAVASREGLRSAFAFPIKSKRKILGVIEFFTRESRSPDDALLKVVETLGLQIGECSERWRAERELRESAILRAALDAIIIIDKEGRILEWNAAAETTFVRKRAEVLGENLFGLIAPPALQRNYEELLRQHLNPSHAGLLGQRIELIATRRNGSEFPIELALTPVSRKRPPLFMAYVRDITDRKMTDESLRASEAEFRAVFELAASGKCQADPRSGRFLRVNRKLCDIAGYSKEELLGLTFSQITHPDDRAKDLDQFQRLIAGELAEYSTEKRYVRKDGRTVWVHVTTTLIRDAHGSPLRTVGVVLDIDDRKRMEKALRDSEERYRLILENALEFAIFTLDKEGRVTSWNAGAQRILGYEESEILGQHLELIFPESDQNKGLPELEMGRALTHGRAQDERWHVRKDRSPFWASGLMMPVKDDNGEHVGFLKILRDRTARKQAEEVLHQTQERFRQLADAMPQIVWTARADGKVDYYNRRWYEFTGLPQDQPLEQNWRLVLHREDVARWEEKWVQAVQSGEPFQLECRFLDREKGSFRWFLARALPSHDDRRNIARWYGTCTDIDQQKRGEERFVRLNETLVAVLEAFPDVVFVVDSDGRIEFKNPAAGKFASEVGIASRLPPFLQSELDQVIQTGEHHLPTSFKTVHRFEINNQERYFLSRVVGMTAPDNTIFGAVVMLQDVTEFRLLDQVKTNLISTVSHELKTPITSLRTALHVLLERSLGPLNTSQREMAGIACDEAERLLRTLDSLLDLTRFEEGAVGMLIETTTPDVLIQAAIEETRVAAVNARVSIKLELEGGLPPLMVDRERIIHVLTNLITNAIKYSPPDSELLVRALKRPPGTVYFGVMDKGPGVPKQYQSRIFERFFRVPGNDKKGAGLGLSIAREFVRAHRGRIGVQSELGQGSEFYFVLPAAEV